MDEKLLGQYFEYLETETGMPYDLIDRAVADFGYQMGMMKKFYEWKEKKYPNLPFK